MQHKSDKACAFKEKHGISGADNLMIVDISKGLLIPMVSSLPTFVP